MALDKKGQPLVTGDGITLECKPTGEKAAPGYVLLRTESDSEGYRQEFGVHESQVSGGKVRAVVAHADATKLGRNIIVRIKAETDEQREHFFALSSVCVTRASDGQSG